MDKKYPWFATNAQDGGYRPTKTLVGVGAAGVVLSLLSFLTGRRKRRR